MAFCCFEQGCDYEVEYICLCLASETYCCEFHLEAHLKLPNRAHTFDSVLIKPFEWTTYAILGFLTKEKSKIEKLNRIVKAFINKHIYNQKECFEENLRMINSDLDEISSLIEKIYQIPQQIYLLSSYILEPDPEREKTIISKGSDLYNDIKLFYRLKKLRYNTSEILNRANNNRKTEQYFRKILVKYNYYTSNPLLYQAYQDLICAYQKLTSHYFIRENQRQAKFLIYSTETETEIEEILHTSAHLDAGTITAQLPNGELFCWSNKKYSGIALIIDKNYKSRLLPSGMRFINSKAIYFKRNIYCIGGQKGFADPVADVHRFDLDQNRWIKLIPITYLYHCNIIIFKRNILICNRTKNLLMYSTDINSISAIPCNFSSDRNKFLISSEEKLYLIEAEMGYIYESDIHDEYSWTRIVLSIVKTDPFQLYYSYNKGGIYVSTYGNERRNFKFDLHKNSLIETAYHNNYQTLRRVDDRLEEIKICGETLKVDPDQYTAYFNKGYTLFNLGEKLQNIQRIKKVIKRYPNDKKNDYSGLGYYYLDLDNQKSMKYFNKALTLNSSNELTYFGKGYVLHELNRNLEALECYNEAIKLSPNHNRSLWYRANLLNDLGREAESIEDFIKVYELTDKASIVNYSYCGIPRKDFLEFIEILCNLQKRAIEFKEESQKLKEINKNNPEIVKEIEEKEIANIKQRSSIIKRAARWLDFGDTKSIIELKLIETEINECQEDMNHIAAQLWPLISIQIQDVN